MNINDSNGWIKLNRRINNSWLQQDNNAYLVFVKMIFWAHHSNNVGSIRINKKQEYLKRGQFSMSMREMAELTNLPLSTLSGVIDRLKTERMIEHSGSLFTICNYNKYQDKTEHSTERSPNTDRTATEHLPLSQKKEEVKKEEINHIDEIDMEVLNPKPNQLVKQGGLGVTLVDDFELTFGLRLTRPGHQRAAANELARDYGIDKVRAMLKYAHSIQGKPYAPQILSVEDLRDKWNKLIAFEMRAQSKKPKVRVITEGNDF